MYSVSRGHSSVTVVTNNGGDGVDTDEHLITVMQMTINNCIVGGGGGAVAATKTNSANESVSMLRVTTGSPAISPSPVRRSGGIGDSTLDAGAGSDQQSENKRRIIKKMCQSKSTFYVPVNDSDIDEMAEESAE